MWLLMRLYFVSRAAADQRSFRVLRAAENRIASGFTEHPSLGRHLQRNKRCHHQHRDKWNTSCSSHVQRATLNVITLWIPEQIPQQSFDNGLVAIGGCSTVRGELTNCVLDVWKTQLKQSAEYLYVPALNVLIQNCVILLALLENEIVRTPGLTRAKVCAQLLHVVLSDAEDEPLRRAAQGSSQELLTFFLSPLPFPS